MKGAFREQLEQAVKFENQVFAGRARSDEAAGRIQLTGAILLDLG